MDNKHAIISSNEYYMHILESQGVRKNFYLTQLTLKGKFL